MGKMHHGKYGSFCKFCKSDLKPILDLGTQPFSNSMITLENYYKLEKFYTLMLSFCEKCNLFQTPTNINPSEIFDEDYPYYSSVSESWLKHCKNYCKKIIQDFSLNENSKVIEIASNDGYLLNFFKKSGIPVLGIEPSKNVANTAKKLGIETIVDFFDENLAKKQFAEPSSRADIIIANNVLAHVPDINSFVKGISMSLKEDGVCTIEFPSVMNLIKELQFDTIYHEHYSYLSLTFVKLLFSNVNMRLFNAEKLLTHGGSYRAYFCLNNSKHLSHEIIEQYITEEKKSGIFDVAQLNKFRSKVSNLKIETLKLLLHLKEKNKQIVGYGAAAKATTLMNYFGLDKSIITYVVDKNRHKQNKYIPGSRVPVLDPEEIYKTKPDYIIIFPWNIKAEILSQILPNINWDCKFITILPENRIE